MNSKREAPKCGQHHTTQASASVPSKRAGDAGGLETTCDAAHLLSEREDVSSALTGAECCIHRTRCAGYRDDTKEGAGEVSPYACEEGNEEGEEGNEMGKDGNEVGK
jgi:hypothetical protein